MFAIGIILSRIHLNKNYLYTIEKINEAIAEIPKERAL
jgi:hypothetical protein